MAGAGKKTFTAGETLTASDVNNYLMDQSVMVFGGTAARSSAIPTPSEGMFAVTTDNDELDYYDGAAWVPALPVGAWQTWSPVLSDGWTNGTGTWTASYIQIGKTVHAKAIFTTGNGLKGTNFTVSLPVTANFNIGSYAQGVAGMTIAGTVYSGRVLAQTSTTSRVLAERADSTYVSYVNLSATIPASWAASGDIIRLSLTYEAA